MHAPSTRVVPHQCPFIDQALGWVADASARIGDFEAEAVEAVQEELHDVAEALEGLRSSIIRLRDFGDNHLEAREGLESQVADLESQVGDLESTRDRLEVQNGRLASALEESERALSEAHSRIYDLEQELAQALQAAG